MAFDPRNRARAYAVGQTVERADIDVGLRQYMLRIYNYMTTGLAISGLVAWTVANVPAVTGIFYTMQGGQIVGINGLGIIAMWAPLIMLFGAMFLMRNPSASGAQIFYWLFVAVNGIGLSILMLVYTSESRRFIRCTRTAINRPTTALEKKLTDADQPAAESDMPALSTSTPIIAGKTSNGMSVTVPIIENAKKRRRWTISIVYSPFTACLPSSVSNVR